MCMPEMPNIVFIMSDSMDGRVMGCMGHPAMRVDVVRPEGEMTLEDAIQLNIDVIKKGSHSCHRERHSHRDGEPQHL